MRKWHDTKRCRAAERHAKDRLRHPPSAPLSGRGEGGGGEGVRGEGVRGEGEGRGSVMPKILRSRSCHHRLEACGHSNGRHRLA